MGWAKYHLERTMRERLEAVPYHDRPWAERYPELLRLLDGEPEAPKRNVISRNICWRDTSLEAEEAAMGYLSFGDNLLQSDPLFRAPPSMDFRLLPESPAWKIGFTPIPVEKIGPE